LSETLDRVRVLVARGEVRISLHGYEELAADKILVRDVVSGLAGAVVVEDYPDYPKGPCILVLEQEACSRQFTSFGVSRRAKTRRLWWSRRTDLTQ
jgi:hypothetical protein